ncbi:MAG: ribosome-associated translation inhibitor RaiA [Chrysiogenia bacterium]
MKITTTSRNLEMTDAIRKYIEEKIGSLEKYNKEIIETKVEIDKNTHHKKGNVFTVEVNMKIPNDLIRTEHLDENLYAAIDEVREDTLRQIRKRKSKYESKERESRKTKRMIKSIFFWRK